MKTKNKRVVRRAAGLHLWDVHVKYGFHRNSVMLLITTATEAMESALSKARKFLQRNATEFPSPVSVETATLRGTIDA